MTCCGDAGNFFDLYRNYECELLDNFSLKDIFLLTFLT